MCRAPPGTTREHAGTGARAVPQVRAAGPPAAARLLWPQRGSAPPPCRVLSSLPQGVDEDPAGMTHCACGLHSLMRPVRNVRGSLFAETWTPEQQLSDATRPRCPEGRAGACLSSWTWGAGISISRASPSPCAVGREGGGGAFQVVESQTRSLLWEHGSLLTASRNSRVALAAAARFSADRALVPPWAWRVRVTPSPGRLPGGPGLLSPGPRARGCSASLPRFPVCPES